MFHSIKKALMAVVVLAALALGGATIASAASSSSSTTTQSTSTTNTQSPPRMFNGPAPGTAAHEDAEKAVTGSAAAKAQAAAVKSVGSGTAGPVTTDLSGQGYETTVTKADGTKVEVHLDSSFNVLQHPAPGGPGGPGAPGGAGAPQGYTPGA